MSAVAPSVEGSIVFYASIPTPPEVAPGPSIRLLRESPFCDEIVLHVSLAEDALLKRLPDGSLEPILVGHLDEDLLMGRLVRAWTVEPVTGCPWSGDARVVEVVAG